MAIDKRYLLHKIITLNFLLGGILAWFPLKIHNTVEKSENVTAKFVRRFRCKAARLWRKQVRLIKITLLLSKLTMN
jgi:predicted ferric reductase